MDIPQKIDLHMHSAVSDGSDSPAQLLAEARSAGLGLFALTDHDAVKGCLQLRELLEPGDALFLSGVEFSCRDGEGKYHILGYGYDPLSPAILGLVEFGHSLRMKKIHARLAFLEREFGFVFPEEEKRRLLARDNPGKPHIGNLMVKLGYAESKEQAIREYINKLSLRDDFIRPEQAIRGILAAGGIPVLAHPFYGDGDQLILGQEMDRRLRRLMDFGIRGVEAFYSGFSEKMTGEMLVLAERYDLLVTAGSDYHGKNKLISLGDTGLEDASQGPAGLLRFFAEVRDKL